jgi:hypothetical protein
MGRVAIQCGALSVAGGRLARPALAEIHVAPRRERITADEIAPRHPTIHIDAGTEFHIANAARETIRILIAEIRIGPCTSGTHQEQHERGAGSAVHRGNAHAI